jgi:hypothetical protein
VTPHERRTFADGDLPSLRINVRDIDAVTRRDPKIAPLPNRKLVNAIVRSKRAPLFIDHNSGTNAATRALRHEGVIATRWHETQFLTLPLFRAEQTKLGGLGTDFCLRAVAQRKPELTELRPKLGVKKIALVLGSIDSAMQLKAPTAFHDPGVVPGCYHTRTKVLRNLF